MFTQFEGGATESELREMLDSRGKREEVPSKLSRQQVN